MKDHVAGIKSITVDWALGLYGLSNVVVMTIDLKDMDAWNALLASDYHTNLGNMLDQYFDAADAKAMIDIIERHLYVCQQVTLISGRNPDPDQSW